MKRGKPLKHVEPIEKGLEKTYKCTGRPQNSDTICDSYVLLTFDMDRSSSNRQIIFIFVCRCQLVLYSLLYSYTLDDSMICLLP